MIERERSRSLVATAAHETGARCSRDGKWMAYGSDASDGTDVYLRSLGADGAQRRVSPDGGMHPEWRADGKELFFVSRGSRMMAAEVEAGRVIGIKELFRLPSPVVPNEWSPYGVSADGQRFLVPWTQWHRQAFDLIENWPDVLKSAR